MKILFAASEAFPFMASGGLADVAGSLPKALQGRDQECRIVMPLYGDIRSELKEKMKYITNFTVPLAWRQQYCGVFEAEVDGVTYYFLDNEYYFKRKGIYGFYDDAERFSFFAKAIPEMLNYIDYAPDIIHCNDWQTALTPVYLNLYFRHNPKFQNIRTVFTIHNIQYQGRYGMEIVEDVMGIPKYAGSMVEMEGCSNMMKGAIEQSDMVTTVSPTYAWEITDPWFSHGLDELLRRYNYKLAGILNGIDGDVYNPATDPNIAKNYTVKTVADKKVNKRDLVESMGLEYKDEVPVVGMVTRLVAHKGLDLVKYIFEDLLRLGVQFVILGSGDYIFENFFNEMQARYPEQVAVKIGFIPSLARKIYAGADMFLMPSKSEPCGLAQMISLRYGTIPIVRETGGLKDSIKDLGGEGGNGYTFKTYNAHDMLGAVQRAVSLYHYHDKWKAAVVNAMKCDFSWARSADEYIKVYKRVLGLSE
ncbi:glycogen synthase GlgA [Zongyangia hominis]|uniref:Glycogen synthase n=1 Tax=Zongyangia hominis TaxID=2763677 RepID=A0A926IBA2_9FIRM|nr:glycogen synthase GlgA [Zongyangia hominis]MBC8571036.1 glycogen synthase GlgA [Zongyangia hominis]